MKPSNQHKHGANSYVMKTNHSSDWFVATDKRGHQPLLSGEVFYYFRKTGNACRKNNKRSDKLDTN